VMTNEKEEFLKLAEECGATNYGGTGYLMFTRSKYLALCKKVQDKQKEKDTETCISMGWTSNGPDCAEAIRKGE
jgi:hypothetical protein